MPSIGIGIRIGKQVLPYWTPPKLLNFWGVGRSGLTIPDSFGNDATILLPYVNITATSYLRRTMANFASGDASGFIEARVYVDQANLIFPFSSSDQSGNVEYFRVYILNTGKTAISVRDGAVFSNIFITNNAIAVGWHTIRWESTGIAYKISVDGVEVACTASGGANDGKWASSVPNYRDNITIGNSLKATVENGTGYIAWVNYNDSSRWYLTGQGLYEYDNIGILDMTYVGAAVPVYGASGSSYLLDNGFSKYEKAGQVNEYVPNTALDTPRAVPALLATYTKVADYDGSAVKHNTAPSLIDFSVSALDSFDRSNVTIFSNDARAGHSYDAANPLRWRAEDIADPNVYYAWKNAGYQWLQFAKIISEDEIPLMLEEVLSFAQEPSSFELERIIEYCKIDYYFA